MNTYCQFAITIPYKAIPGEIKLKSICRNQAQIAIQKHTQNLQTQEAIPPTPSARSIHIVDLSNKIYSYMYSTRLSSVCIHLCLGYV